jgi:hypothetical protein
VQPRHDSSERRIHNRRDLAVAEALGVNQVQDLPELSRQFGQGLYQLGVGYPRQRAILGGGCRRRHDGGRRAVLVLLDVIDGQDGLAALFTVAVDEGVQHNAVQPGSHVRAGSEPRIGGAGPQDCLLHQVLGVLAVPGHLQGGAQKLPLVRNGLALELLRKRGRHFAFVHPGVPPVPDVGPMYR